MAVELFPGDKRALYLNTLTAAGGPGHAEAPTLKIDREDLLKIVDVQDLGRGKYVVTVKAQGAPLARDLVTLSATFDAKAGPGYMPFGASIELYVKAAPPATSCTWEE